MTRVSYEGIKSYVYLADFDKTSIKYLPWTWKETTPATVEDLNAIIAAKIEIYGANVGLISIRRIIVAVNAAKYYKLIERSSYKFYQYELHKYTLQL